MRKKLQGEIDEYVKEIVHEKVGRELKRTIAEGVEEWLNSNIRSLAATVVQAFISEQKEQIWDLREMMVNKTEEVKEEFGKKYDEISKAEMQKALRKALEQSVDVIKDQLLIDLAGKALGTQAPKLQKIEIDGLTELVKSLGEGKNKKEYFFYDES